MNHTLDNIIDSDKYFIIDPITRTITNQTSAKNSLIQYDHNSEVFTFKIPREIENHDMFESDSIQVHYINKGQSDLKVGVYKVTDAKVVTEENSEFVEFSWLVSMNTTQLTGDVSFQIKFICYKDDDPTVPDYVWSTKVFSAINVLPGINNADVVVEMNADILAVWEEKLLSLLGTNTTASGNNALAVGRNTIASGHNSLAAGYNTEAIEYNSFAVGEDTFARWNSLASGYKTRAANYATHTEGISTEATKEAAHAEGEKAKAKGRASHARNYNTEAVGVGSSASGCGTVATSDYGEAKGKYNEIDEEKQYAVIVGNGTDENNRSNIFTLDWAGHANYKGSVTCPAIYLMSASGKGHIVTVNEDGDLFIDYKSIRQVIIEELAKL